MFLVAVQIPFAAQDQAYSFWHLRRFMQALASPGVVNPSTDFVVTPASGLQVSVSSGYAFVQQTVQTEGASAYNGLYGVLNDAAASPFNTITAPISNPRIDQVILRVYDIAEQGLGGSSKAQIEWLTGSENAAASLATMGPGLSNPGAASLPANSLRLAYILNTVGASSIPSGNILNMTWNPLTPGSGVTAVSSWGTVGVSATSTRAFLHGALQNTSGGNLVSSIWATLPTFVPSFGGVMAAVAVTSGGTWSTVPIEIIPNSANITVNTTISALTIVYLNGVSYPLI